MSEKFNHCKDTCCITQCSLSKDLKNKEFSLESDSREFLRDVTGNIISPISGFKELEDFSYILLNKRKDLELCLNLKSLLSSSVEEIQSKLNTITPSTSTRDNLRIARDIF